MIIYSQKNDMTELGDVELPEVPSLDALERDSINATGAEYRQQVEKELAAEKGDPYQRMLTNLVKDRLRAKFDAHVQSKTVKLLSTLKLKKRYENFNDYLASKKDLEAKLMTGFWQASQKRRPLR